MPRPVVPVFFLLLSACSSLKDYDVTLNDRVVYSPRPLAVDPAVVDPALADCIAQTLADQAIKSPDKLTDLNCSNAGIARLDGIGVYRRLRQLGLAGNALQSVAPLAGLAELTLLDLSDNSALDCSTLTDLRVDTLRPPAQCAP
jgi:Leucine-rich repeat (LRR) protein